MAIFYWQSSAESESIPIPNDPFGFTEIENEYHLYYSERMEWLPGPDRLAAPIDRATFDELRACAIGQASSFCGREWIGLYFAPPRFPRLTTAQLAERYDLPEAALPLIREGLARDGSPDPEAPREP